MSDAQARVAGDSMPDRRQREDTAAIRVSNLSENVQEADLQVSATVMYPGSLLDSQLVYQDNPNLTSIQTLCAVYINTVLISLVISY